MVITMKTLVMFVFTTFFIISFADSLYCPYPPTAATIPADFPGYGPIVCFRLTKPCLSGGWGESECQKLCDERGNVVHQCSQDECYCEKLSMPRT
ncbi:unnamed protein product [Brassica oleracea var. botrytis]|uniref:Knottin scorpion toxin-like domain-containing protein n=1 Tax=Brassica oleracea TaxID=3712 RepID=A0A3P6FKK4_BRAOL|nr:unnamed protein product [Brassica oleracea]